MCLFLGIACACRRAIPKLNLLVPFLAVTIVLAIISHEFDDAFLADLPKLEGGFSALPKPLFGCSHFEAYYQDFITGDARLYDSWKVEIGSKGCGLGVLSTMLISCSLVWLFTLSASFSLVSIIRLLRNKAQAMPHHQPVISVPIEDTSEHTSSDKEWDIAVLPDRFRADKLDDRTNFDRIHALIDKKKDQTFGWEGHKLKCFLLNGNGGLSLESNEVFRMGFNHPNHKGYVNVTYANTVGALHHRYMALGTTERTLEWAAYSADIHLKELVERFWHLYNKNLIKLVR